MPYGTHGSKVAELPKHEVGHIGVAPEMAPAACMAMTHVHGRLAPPLAPGAASRRILHINSVSISDRTDLHFENRQGCTLALTNKQR